MPFSKAKAWSSWTFGWPGRSMWSEAGLDEPWSGRTRTPAPGRLPCSSLVAEKANLPLHAVYRHHEQTESPWSSGEAHWAHTPERRCGQERGRGWWQRLKGPPWTCAAGRRAWLRGLRAGKEWTSWWPR